MFSLFVAPTLDRESFRTIAEADGFVMIADPPLTDVRRDTILARDSAAALYAGTTSSSVALVRLHEQAGSLRAALGDRLVPALDYLARPQAAGRIARLRFLHDVLFLLSMADEDESRAAFALLFAALDDDDDVVAHAAAQGLGIFVSPAVAGALDRAATRRPRLRALADHVRDGVRASAEGTLHDTPTTHYTTLRQRAEEGVERQQWTRVLAATRAILDQETWADDVAALAWRGLALEGTGQPVLALAHLGAARARVPSEVDDDNRRDAAMAPAIDEAIARVGARVKALPVEAREQEADALSSWLDGVEGLYKDAVRHGAASALLDLVPSLTPVLLWHVASHTHDLEGYRRLFERVPDSRTVLFRLGRALAKAKRRSDAIKVLRDALACTPTSDMARRLDALDPTSDEDISEEILRQTYNEKRFDETAALAAAHLERFPGSQQGWQIRANGLLFAGRLDEAEKAYAEAVSALDRILDSNSNDSIRFGEDPRGAMHFNRGCALAKLGRFDEAVDELRRSVRRVERFATDAPKDDWLAPLLDRDDFRTIVALDPAALVLPEERDPTFVAGLIARANHLDYVEGKLDEARTVAERAAMLAGSIDHPMLASKALALVGRLLLADGDEGWVALTQLQRAAVLARHESVPVNERAETLQSLGHSYRILGSWDEAERAYAEALDLRKQAHGESSHIVAKSHGDLAVLAQARGEPTSAVLAHLRTAITVIEAFLASPAATAPGAEHARNESLVDLGTNRMNESRLLTGESDLAGAVRAATLSLDAFEAAIRGGDHVRQSLLEQELNRYGVLADEAPSHRDAFRELYARTEAILVPGGPAEREERRYWRRWRNLASEVLNDGMEGSQFADLMLQALRSDMPEAVARVPLFRGFAAEMARRFDRYPTFVIMLPMALDTAKASGDLLKALHEIEELCVASLLAGDD